MKAEDTVSFARWKRFLEFIRTKPSEENLMMYVCEMIDNMRGFHYSWLANLQPKYIELALKESK